MDENENSCERAFHCNGSIFPTSQVAFGFKFNSFFNFLNFSNYFYTHPFFNSLNVLRGYFTQKLATDKLTGYCENDWILLNGKIEVLLNLNLSIQEINLKTSASHVLHWKAFNFRHRNKFKKVHKIFSYSWNAHSPQWHWASHQRMATV